MRTRVVFGQAFSVPRGRWPGVPRAWPGMMVAMLVSGLAAPALAFDKADRARMEKRLIFFEKGSYAVGVTKAIEHQDQKPGGKFPRSAELTCYWVGPATYDPLFALALPWPVELEQGQRAVTFRSGGQQLSVGAEGIEIRQTFTAKEGGESWRIWMLGLNSIRFDGAIACVRQGNRTVQTRLGHNRMMPAEPPLETAKVEPLLAAAAASPRFYAIRTEEGLWTTWEFRLEGAASNYAPHAMLRLLGGGGMPAFYDVARKMPAGARAAATLKFQARPEEGYPLPVPVRRDVQLIDSHIHVTSLTDLRDSALLARKHGLRYCLLSILYNEGPYARLFEGDGDMWAALRRYPDVFVGFGLIQLNAQGYPGYLGRKADTPEHVEQLRRDGCLGVKTLEKWSRKNVSDADVDPIYRKVQELGMPIVFHTEEEGDGPSHTNVAAVARKFPKMPVIMAHLSPKGQLDKTIGYLKELPNLYLQHMHLEYVRAADGKTALQTLIAEGLAHKILFGSDYQQDYGPLAGDVWRYPQRLKELGLSQEQVDAIMYKTMQGLLPKR